MRLAGMSRYFFRLERPWLKFNRLLEFERVAIDWCGHTFKHHKVPVLCGDQAMMPSARTYGDRVAAINPEGSQGVKVGDLVIVIR